MTQRSSERRKSRREECDREHETKIVASRTGKLPCVVETAVIDEPPRHNPPNPERHLAWSPAPETARTVGRTMNIDASER